MANQASPSIKDNPFKRLDALRTKVSGVKAPAPSAAAPPVPPRRPSDGSAASHTSMASPPVPPRPATAPKLPPRRPSDASTASKAWPRAGVGDPGGPRDDRGRPADDDRAREEEGLHLLFPPVADGRSQAEDLQAAEEALEYRH